MDNDFVFQEPWEIAESPDVTLEQLETEVIQGHPLFGQVTKVLASRVDGDDILVQTKSGFALVHLTWCRRSEPALPFPHTVLFDDWNEFLKVSYNPEREQWTQENPEDEWDEILSKQ